MTEKTAEQKEYSFTGCYERSKTVERRHQLELEINSGLVKRKTISEIAEETGAPKEAVIEWYDYLNDGDNIEYIYTKDEGAIAGVEYTGGRYCIVGLRMDSQIDSFADMIYYVENF